MWVITLFLPVDLVMTLPMLSQKHSLLLILHLVDSKQVLLLDLMHGLSIFLLLLNSIQFMVMPNLSLSLIFLNVSVSLQMNKCLAMVLLPIQTPIKSFETIFIARQIFNQPQKIILLVLVHGIVLLLNSKLCDFLNEIVILFGSNQKPFNKVISINMSFIPMVSLVHFQSIYNNNFWRQFVVSNMSKFCNLHTQLNTIMLILVNYILHSRLKKYQASF
mmetsp:Transcript_7194/g.10970  ORF Transcript_7194/g.10970 Transcript_7194/m.10970 type:complete len:218 (+) Transcript_7194:94-747(+)